MIPPSSQEGPGVDNELKIQIVDESRPNDLLDEAMGVPRTGGPAGGASRTAPAFPATIRGADGRQYDFGEYAKAADRADKEAKRNKENQAYDAFFGPQAPGFPATVTVDGKRYSWEAYTAATNKANREAKQRSADEAYKALYGGPLTPPDTVRSNGKRMSLEDYFKGRAGQQGGASGIEAILGQLGGGGLMRSLGGAGGALGAAGIVGGVVMAAQQMTTSLNNMRQGVDVVASGLEGLAHNDLSKLDDGVNDLRRSVVGAVPVLGDLANAQGDLIRSIVNIPSKLTAAFIARGHEIGGFSAAITGAEARSEVKTTFADLKEAQELGPAMARMIDAETNLSIQFREIMLPVKRVIVELLADRLEAIGKMIDAVVNLPEIIEKIADDLGRAIVEAVRFHGDKALGIIEGIPRDIDEVIRKNKKDDDFVDTFDQFYAALGGDINHGPAPTGPLFIGPYQVR
jgi:hypothetical protein